MKTDIPNAEGLRSADRRRDADKQHPLVGGPK